ncbi:MAG: hypothetical protein ACXVAG_13515 [Vulcanimicrobiaceae bacterium]
MRLASKPGDDVRILWMCAILVAIGGYYAVDTRYQQAIGTAGEVTQQLYERVSANERIIRQAARLIAVQTQVNADIARFEKDRSSAGTTSALLMMLAASAKRFNTQIVAVEPAPATPTSASTPAPAELMGTDVTIRVHGRFRDLLNFVEDLSHHRVLLAVADTQLTVANGTDATAPSPALDATVRATVYRLAVDAVDYRRP